MRLLVSIIKLFLKYIFTHNLSFQFLAIYASVLAAELGGHWGAGGEEITWWSAGPAPLNKWFTTYPSGPPSINWGESSESGKLDGHKVIKPSTDSRQPGTKYDIIELSSLPRF